MKELAIVILIIFIVFLAGMCNLVITKKCVSVGIEEQTCTTIVEIHEKKSNETNH